MTKPIHPNRHDDPTDSMYSNELPKDSTNTFFNTLIPKNSPMDKMFISPAPPIHRPPPGDYGNPSLIEIDPHGIGQHISGAKLDHGKVKVHLMLSGFADALYEVARVTTHGAEKYTENGWKHVDNGVSRYLNAARRHFIKGISEQKDRDSGCDHDAQEIWNLLAAYQLKINERKDNQKTVDHFNKHV